MDDPAELSFIGILLTDLALAIQRHDISGNQTAKRDVIRTSFAALEGSVWVFREHVIEAAKTTGNITVAEEFALTEQSFQVTDTGVVKTQPKFLPIRTAIRLTARISERFIADAKIDFSSNEWKNLKLVAKIRDRITHPKHRQDIALSEDDIITSLSATFWFLEQLSGVMAGANLAMSQYVIGVSELLVELKAGDPKTLDEYQAAARALQDEE